MGKKVKIKIKDVVTSVGRTGKTAIKKGVITPISKMGKVGKTVVSKTIIKPVGKVAVKVSREISKRYKKGSLKPKVNKAVTTIDETFDKTGVKAKAKRVKHVTTKHIDTFTGTRQFRLMQERMTLQQRYNDVLATKLEEALQRVERLENLLEQKEGRGKKKWALRNLRRNIKIPKKFL